MRENTQKKISLAIKRGYLSLESKKGKTVEDTYRNWCTQNRVVFICVRRSTYTSIIEFDFSIHKYGETFTKDAFERYIKIALQYSDPYRDKGGLFQRIEHIPNSDVENIIEEILTIIDEGLIKTADDYSTKDIIDRALSSKISKVRSESRNPEISKLAKKVAQGICKLCNQPAPFKDREGVPYLEAHHIVWRSRGGDDTIENVVALCPNCHRKMHILDLAEDRAVLLEKVKRHLL